MASGVFCRMVLVGALGFFRLACSFQQQGEVPQRRRGVRVQFESLLVSFPGALVSPISWRTMPRFV